MPRGRQIGQKEAECARRESYPGTSLLPNPRIGGDGGRFLVVVWCCLFVLIFPWTLTPSLQMACRLLLPKPRVTVTPGKLSLDDRSFMLQVFDFILIMAFLGHLSAHLPAE